MTGRNLDTDPSDERDPRSESDVRIPIVMTAAEVGRLLHVATKTVYKYKDCDGLPCHQPVKGGAVRFYQHEVLEWMSGQPSEREGR